ncbi:hypothetical protein AVEN_82962-1 [Araneus ventricosus]|uniref:Tc1-like transposase DDE domain-containing protein n=1 Tax=Araneus ventricosus TaxID=182803 RepID=A0A4Y2I212_ARAVE|nr:hypothetical protein AVEN_82962-1 [Araneus ventricosus]
MEYPPYCPNLSPSDFHLFAQLKKHLAGPHFRTDVEVQEAIVKCLRDLSLISSVPVSIDWFIDGTNASTTIVTMWKSNMYQYLSSFPSHLFDFVIKLFLSRKAYYLTF